MINQCDGLINHSRFLPRLTTNEISSLNKSESILILPMGSVEQHGAHLPVFTDSYINQRLIIGALNKLPENTNAWVLPSISYGKSNEHFGFSGTFSLSTTTLFAVLMDLIRNIVADGWQRLLIINSHGGNPEIISLAARDARVEKNLMVFSINTGGLYEEDLLPERENEYGIHGGALETSLMLYLKPEWVDSDKYNVEYPAAAECSCFKLSGSMTFSWKSSDLSKTGVIGDPSISSKELGRKIYERVTTEIANSIKEAANWNW